MKKDIPPSIPLDQREAMNFLFGKNAFFGFGGASDGVFSPSPHFPFPSLQMILTAGHDVVDELGYSKGIHT